MDTRVLQYFLTVVREENITKAADILHITQPTLSRQLSALEESLGVRLFSRSKKGIVLTDEGILFRRRASEIVELVDKAEKELSENEESVDGEIAIGCGELESVKLVAKLFASFKEKYPNIFLDLYTGDADQIKQRIDNGVTDIGILLEPVEIAKYDFIRLNVKENWVVLMPADDPLAQKEYVTIEELSRLPIISPHRQSVKNEMESWFLKYADNLNVVASSNLSTNASILVEQGIGYAVSVEGALPYWDKTKVTFKPIYPPRTSTSVLAWKKHQPFSTAVNKFIEYVQYNI